MSIRQCLYDLLDPHDQGVCIKDISPTSHGDNSKSKSKASSQIIVVAALSESKPDTLRGLENVFARTVIQEGVTS